MDVKVSKKEKRWQQNGPVLELVDDIFDLYPITVDNVITDIQTITGDEELLDRAMFSLIKQKGLDPIDKEDGISWAQNVIGEVPSDIILLQVQNEVQKEGPMVILNTEITGKGTNFTLAIRGV